MQFEAKRFDHLEDGVKAWRSLSGERFVKAFSREPRVSCHLCHSFRSSDVSERFCNKCRVTVRLFKAGLKISSHFFRGPKVLGNVITCGSCLANLYHYHTV